MTKLEQAARQALEALEHLQTWPMAKEAITALREALAEQAECKECGAKQAQIDRLMLEYCPDEMTNKQMREWNNNQRPVEQAEQVPVRNWPLMGYGNVAIGGGKQPDGTPCLLYFDMGETREIDADTTDLFPIGSEAEQSKLLACIYFKDGAAIQQTIGVLQEMQVEIGYAVPVRTKDLTDVDLWNLWEKSDSNIEFARAVIAVDREKNK